MASTFDPYQQIVAMLRQQYQEQFDYQQGLGQQQLNAKQTGQSAQEQAAEAAARAAGSQQAAAIQAAQGNQTAGRQAGVMLGAGQRMFGLATGDAGDAYQQALRDLADQADIALRTVYTPQLQRGVTNSGLSQVGLSDLTNKVGGAQDDAGTAYRQATARAAAALQGVNENAADLTSTAQETGAANVAAAGAQGSASTGAASSGAALQTQQAGENLDFWDTAAKQRLQFNQAQRQFDFDSATANAYQNAIGDIYAY